MFLQAAALGKQLFDITDSELALGLLGLVEFLPALILLPLTGSVADRFDRRRVAAIGLSAEVLTSIAFCVYAASDPTSGTPLFLIAAVFGTARAFVAPSVRSLPPLLAPERGLPRLIALVRRHLAVRDDRRPGEQRVPLRHRPGRAVPGRGGLLPRLRGGGDHAAVQARAAAHSIRRAADPAPCARGPALHPQPAGSPRGDRARPVRRAVRGRRRPPAGDRRGAPRRRQRRVRMAARRAGDRGRRPHRPARGAAGAPARRRDPAHLGRALRRGHRRVRSHDELCHRLPRLARPVGRGRGERVHPGHARPAGHAGPDARPRARRWRTCSSGRPTSSARSSPESPPH